MRSFLIAMALATICGCAKAPYVDLRHPVYFEADNSFWIGCDEDPAGEQACHKSRVEAMYKGFSQWFDYFDKADRPEAVFVSSDKELPVERVNRVIYLGMSDTFCGKTARGTDAGACYYWHKNFWGSPTRVRIMFKKVSEVVARSMAHEFGHALGMDDNYLPSDEGSVMSYDTPTNVTRHDFEVMCRKHHECGKLKKAKRKPWRLKK